jgi:hypothetical protein
MQYIKEGFTLPAPFNLIPVPAAIFKIIKNFFKYLKEKKQPDNLGQDNVANQIEKENTSNVINI